MSNFLCLYNSNAVYERARRTENGNLSPNRYFKLARHLLEEIRGRAKYDESFALEVAKAKELEGTTEAAYQLWLNITLLLDYQ